MTPAQLAASGSEHAHQRALFARIAEYRNEPTILPSHHAIAKQMELLFAIPNGGARHKAVAGKMKAEGVKSGIWDLFLPVPQLVAVGTLRMETKYHGLFIEIKEPNRRKHKDGGLSDEQIKFGNAMHANGYATVVCYTWEEAFAELLKYLGAT